jgi:HEAT repeat protein
MRAISADTRRLIEQLNEPVGFWERVTGSRADAKLLSAIGGLGEPAAIVFIFPFVLADRSDVASAAATAVHRLTAATSPADLAYLDIELRKRWPYAGRYRLDWLRLSPRELGRLERFGEASVSLLGIASFHESGYVREAAIKRLDLITSGAEIPFLLIRLSDWVSNVRDAAHKSIRSRLIPDYCRRFIANLALISRLEQTERGNHQSLIDAIHELLKSAECISVLLEALGSDDRFIRRASFRLALHATDIDLPQVLRQGLRDQDTVIRLWAAQRVSSGVEGAALDRMLTLMKRDRFMPVRREALRIYAGRSLEGWRVELRSALLDTHPSMREEARYLLREDESMDVASFYRQAVSAGSEISLYSVISGLGEAGSVSDVHLLLPYVSHRVAKIRRAAIRALGRLSARDYRSVFVDALTDEVPRVSREALKVLANKASLIGDERLWDIFCSASHQHIKLNALSLLEKLGKWDSICFMVKAVCDSDEEVANRGRLSIQRWLWRFNRGFSSPTLEQLAKLRNVLEECGNRLDDKTMDDLRFSMKGF